MTLVTPRVARLDGDRPQRQKHQHLGRVESYLSEPSSKGPGGQWHSLCDLDSTKSIHKGTDVKMNIEDSLRAKQSGSSHLQDGCEQREGSRFSFSSGNGTENGIDSLFSLSSIYGCELQG